MKLADSFESFKKDISKPSFASVLGQPGGTVVQGGAAGLAAQAYAQGGGVPQAQGHRRGQGTQPMRGGNGLLSVQPQNGRERDLSPATKRAREEEIAADAPKGDQDQGYKPVLPRRRKTNFGKSKVMLDGVDAAPVDIFVGNTNARATEEKIKEVLLLSAAQMPEKPALVINEVKCLNNLDVEPYPRTKCWKTSVPYAFRDLMNDDNLYPAGWSHRTFYAARKKK